MLNGEANVKRFRLSTVFALVVSFFACVALLVTDSSRMLKADNAGSTQARPLKDTIRLAPGGPRIASGRRLLPQVSFKKLDQKFTEFAGNAKSYESGAQALPEIAKQCAAKAYSVQDQKAAGCTGNDTLNQCMNKLYRHCIESYSVGGISIGLPSPITGGSPGNFPGFSTTQFQQSAKTTAAEARALSQLLSQYANEVDQNAKALVP
jgi:uncharacterized protein YukE